MRAERMLMRDETHTVGLDIYLASSIHGFLHRSGFPRTAPHPVTHQPITTGNTNPASRTIKPISDSPKYGYPVSNGIQPHIPTDSRPSAPPTPARLAVRRAEQPHLARGGGHTRHCLCPPISTLRSPRQDRLGRSGGSGPWTPPEQGQNSASNGYNSPTPHRLASP